VAWNWPGVVPTSSDYRDRSFEDRVWEIERVVLVGVSGSGKTTLLRRLQEHHPNECSSIISLDLPFSEVLDRVASAHKHQRTVLLDEGHHLLTWSEGELSILRDKLFRGFFVLATWPSLLGVSILDSAARFFKSAAFERLPYFSRAETASMVRRENDRDPLINPFDVREESVSAIQHATGGHPHLIARLCSFLYDRGTDTLRHPDTLSLHEFVDSVSHGSQDPFQQILKSLAPPQQRVLDDLRRGRKVSLAPLRDDGLATGHPARFTGSLFEIAWSPSRSTSSSPPSPRPAQHLYLQSIEVQNVKLLADQKISFVRPDGTLRRWTVLIGDNGLCKTTLLQAIALTASGEKLARALVDDAANYCRATAPERGASIETTFQVLSPDGHGDPSTLEHLSVRLIVEAGRHDFRGEQGAKRIDDVRGYRVPGYFVVGYGVGRFLPKPGEVAVPQDPVHDRIEGLFDVRHKMLGVEFFDALQAKNLDRAFASALRDVLIARDESGNALMPWLANVEGEEGTDRLHELLAQKRFALDVGGERIRLPSTALSQGYQSMIAWIADLLGQGFLEFGESTTAATLRGIVLLDEIDLHLHPTWQRRIVPILKRVFPELQFIVTTHSPLVLSGFESDEIIPLVLEDGLVVQRPLPVETGMLTASEVLSSHFGVPRAGRPDLVQKERVYLELKARDQRTAEEESQMLALEGELSAYWTPSFILPEGDDAAGEDDAEAGP
jgi:hypothetical protein